MPDPWNQRRHVEFQIRNDGRIRWRFFLGLNRVTTGKPENDNHQAEAHSSAHDSSRFPSVGGTCGVKQLSDGPFLSFGEGAENRRNTLADTAARLAQVSACWAQVS